MLKLTFILDAFGSLSIAPSVYRVRLAAFLRSVPRLCRRCYRSSSFSFLPSGNSLFLNGLFSSTKAFATAKNVGLNMATGVSIVTCLVTETAYSYIARRNFWSVRKISASFASWKRSLCSPTPPLPSPALTISLWDLDQPTSNAYPSSTSWICAFLLESTSGAKHR
ncbi:hypothetical protein BT96DRAFT_990503 [Gymnopus androsaceus JB14]|uniref:Uncharacterized protein n=1 Tax=Gymnopus androsaceus JB14 TaxID=1447944 RepID=A0A6A4HZ07_9AGAR|nr:hypothetical protein BT96DRAFT_990503 [Gymnopus androsaceus JB14]